MDEKLFTGWTVGQKRHKPCALNCLGNLALVLSARATSFAFGYFGLRADKTFK